MNNKKVAKKDLWFSVQKDLSGSTEKKFMGEQDEQGRFKFEGVAYSGKPIMNHPFWNNLVFDVQSMTSDKIVPIFRDHMPDREAGHGTLSFDNGDVTVQGFLYEDEGERAYRLMKKGYPMQESVYIEPTSLEEIKEGEIRFINGQQLEGPMTVFMGGHIKEVSLVSLGADSNTSTKVFNKSMEGSIEIPMEKEREMSQEQEILETNETEAVEALEASSVEQPEVKEVEKEEIKFSEGFSGFLEAMNISPEKAYEFACSCESEKAKTSEDKLKAKIEELELALAEYKQKEKDAKKAAKETEVEQAFAGRELPESIKSILLSSEDDKFKQLLNDLVALAPAKEEKIDKNLFKADIKNEEEKALSIADQRKAFIAEQRKNGASLQQAHFLAAKKFDK